MLTFSEQSETQDVEYAAFASNTTLKQVKEV